jgi:hypothetical protein
VLHCVRVTVAHLPWTTLGRLSEAFKRLLVALKGVVGLGQHPPRVVAQLLSLCSGLVAQAAPASTGAAVCRHIVAALGPHGGATVDLLSYSDDTALSVGVLIRAVLSGLTHDSDRCGHRPVCLLFIALAVVGER